MEKRVYLTSDQKEKLVDAPEAGMGYHLVSVKLKNGEVLNDRIILNCSLLVLNEGEEIKQNDILHILPNASK